MVKNTHYVSELTMFISEYLLDNPQIKEDQKNQRDTWWNVDLDTHEQNAYKQSKIKMPEYVYYDYNKKSTNLQKP